MESPMKLSTILIVAIISLVCVSADGNRCPGTARQEYATAFGSVSIIIE